MKIIDKNYKIQRSYYFSSDNNYVFMNNPWLRKSYRIKIRKNIEISELLHEFAQLEYFSKAEIINALLMLQIGETSAQLLFKKLYQKGIILDFFDEYELQNNRYSRQLLFFENFEQNQFSATEMQNKLKNLKVLIPGLGGYGSWLALFCAQMGVGHIYILDYDSVELTNLNRQVLFFEEDVGLLKVDSLKKKLLQINSSIQVEGINAKITNGNDLQKILKNVDLVYNSFGYFPRHSKYGELSNVILDSCHKNKVDCFFFNGSLVGPIVNNVNREMFDKFVNSDYINEIRNYSIPNFKRFTGALSPRLVFTSSIVAWETLRYQLLNNRLLLDNLIQLDTIEYRKTKIIKLNEIL